MYLLAIARPSALWAGAMRIPCCLGIARPELYDDLGPSTPAGDFLAGLLFAGLIWLIWSAWRESQPDRQAAREAERYLDAQIHRRTLNFMTTGNSEGEPTLEEIEKLLASDVRIAMLYQDDWALYPELIPPAMAAHRREDEARAERARCVAERRKLIGTRRVL